MVDQPERSLILGSTSPRRADLLHALGISFQVQPVDIDEAALIASGDVDVATTVERIAVAKFHAAGPSPTTPPPWLLTADTLVACGDTTMGKPINDKHLIEMLAAMAGNELTIVTALCLAEQGSTPSAQVVSTAVELRSLTDREIQDYVETGAGLDKAAGLALQAEARGFISSVRGCWSNVVGLPLCAVTAGLGLAPHGWSQQERCSTALCGGPAV